MKKAVILVLGIGALVAFSSNIYAANKVKEGSVAVVQYSLTANGQMVTPNEEMKVVVGNNMYPPAYEKQLIGLKEGDKKVIELDPKEAFGDERQDLLKRVPKDQLPQNMTFSEGQILGGKNGQRAMRVVKVLPDSVIFDQNHPLAGKKLVYNIQIKSIN